MGKYRKKPVVIEAISVREALHTAASAWCDLPSWLCDAYERGNVIFEGDHVSIITLEGMMRGMYDDMIIYGIAGEIYPCKPDIFAATYEAA